MSTPARATAVSGAPAVAPRPAPTPTAAPAPADARRAALLLHGLPDSDRSWVLARLSSEERDELCSLTAELEALGIPADRAFVDEALAAWPAARPNGRDGRSSAHDRTEPDLGAERGPATLADANPGAILEVLRDEPDALVARLLSLGEWPWRAALLAALGPARRRAIEDELRRCSALAAPGPDDAAPSAAAALREQLVAAVWRRVAKIPPHPLRRGARGRLRDRVARGGAWLRMLAGPRGRR